VTLRKIAAIGLVGVALPAAAMAQVRPAQTATTAQLQARREISALESILESAVTYGAQMLTQHVQNSNVPDMVMLTGMARARGFRLDGYGVVVDVEFPSIRRSVMWSMRQLRPDKDLLQTLREIRKTMGPGDVAAREAIERDISELEAQIRENDRQLKARSERRSGVTATSTGGAGAGSPTVMPASADDPKIDIKTVYSDEITSALADAILEHGAPVGIADDEWLTVAARESADRGFSPNDPNDTAMTFVLRIKGSDLKALRERRISKDEARKRVEIKQY
jgi:hypothetical protein